MGLAALFVYGMREVFTRTVTAVNVCGSDIVERASAALAVFCDVTISDVVVRRSCRRRGRDVVISRADYIALCARMLSDAIVAASA